MSVSWLANRSARARHPLAYVFVRTYLTPVRTSSSCRFRGDAAADLSFPPLPPWSPARASWLQFGGAALAKCFVHVALLASTLVTCPHPVPCCLPPSSNFGVCSAPGLLGRARPCSPITCEPCFSSPIEGTLSFAFAYPSPCAPPRRPFCRLVIVGVAVPSWCAAKPLGSHMASLLHCSPASSSAAAKTRVGHGCSSIS
jgi:hypothetical protein